MKAALKTILAKSGAFSLGLRLSRGKLRVLMYHGISPRSVPLPVFEQQLGYLTRHFDTYWVSEIPQLLQNLDSLRRPAVVITFDDGLRNNYRYAAPLLERYRAKATFYLVSDLLDGSSMLWNHEIRCRLALADDGALPAAVGRLSKSAAQRWSEVTEFVQAMKSWDDDRRVALCEEVSRCRLSAPYADWMREEFEIMSADEARKLPPLIEIGSHTRTHPMLDRVTEKTAIEEIEGSRRRLELALGRPVRTFCYPNGQSSESVVRIVERCYEVAVTVVQGVVRPGDRLHQLKRIISGVNMEEFFYYLARPPALSDPMQGAQ
jgi:peptidoglycan/xylan/chitin deacetylase (PgdA/CDA1 family)